MLPLLLEDDVLLLGLLLAVVDSLGVLDLLVDRFEVIEEFLGPLYQVIRIHLGRVDLRALAGELLVEMSRLPQLQGLFLLPLHLQLALHVDQLLVMLFDGLGDDLLAARPPDPLDDRLLVSLKLPFELLLHTLLEVLLVPLGKNQRAVRHSHHRGGFLARLAAHHAFRIIQAGTHRTVGVGRGHAVGGQGGGAAAAALGPLELGGVRVGVFDLVEANERLVSEGVVPLEV